MKVGDRLRCTFSIDEIYTVGLLYPILDFDTGGDPIIADNDGVFWKFEVVDEQEETEALLQLLQMSQKDVEEGRIMSRDQLIESLSKG